jgi:hypothetical protein
MSGANLTYRCITDLLAKHRDRIMSAELESLADIAHHACLGRTLRPDEVSHVSRLRAEIAREIGWQR